MLPLRFRRFLFVFAIISAAGVHGLAQTTTEILDRLAKTRVEYRERFRDLLADELKTFEDFDREGFVKSKSTVLSSFLVYRSGKKSAPASELRNVRAVNGRPVPGSEKRAEKFLAELERQKTPESELQKLVKEGARFDKTWIVNGLTLSQAVTLAANLRPLFKFTDAGSEKIGDRDNFVIDYFQTVRSEYVIVNRAAKSDGKLYVAYEVNIPRPFNDDDVRLRGRLWIDKETGRLRRETRELVVSPDAPKPVFVTQFEYEPSEFGLFLPKSVTIEVLTPRPNTDEKLIKSRFQLAYSNFRQTNVEVTLLDDETPQP